jgi:23S rRNA (pseudouridine1915-N3)-methyltransferase
MKLVLLTVGKTDSAALQNQIDTFGKRLSRYIPFRMECLTDLKFGGKTEPAQICKKQGEQILDFLKPQDVVWLLDEKGREFTSRGFAAYLQKTMNTGPKRLVLLIGGAYGFSPEVRNRADASICLSRMTFNHQIVRLMAVEQLYRGYAILKGDPYHND